MKNKINWSKQTDLGRAWGIMKLVLTVCSFFWFGWVVGVLFLIMSVDFN